MSGMESGIPTRENSENKKTFRLEKLPWADVVLNLDADNKEDPETVLEIIKKNGQPQGPLAFAQISFSEDEEGKFFAKTKDKTVMKQQINFALGRSNMDPVDVNFREDFDKQARFAYSSILNEIILSPKIKRLVASDDFQKLAKKYGFSGMDFIEPVAGVIEKYYKYLIYRNLKGTENPATLSVWRRFKIENFTNQLRKLFLANGIKPNDLRSQQFMATKKGDEYFLHLIDIEAYTEKK